MWRAAPLPESQALPLEFWAVTGLPNGDRHFAGYSAIEWHGCTSSKITRYDPTTRRGVTSSGRVYELVGPPGLDGSGDDALQGWLRIHRAASYVNVSSEYVGS